MNNYIRITDVFENAVNTFHTLSPYESSVIAQNIAELEYIDDLIKRNRKIFQQLLNKMATEIYQKTMTPDIMQLSAFYYKGKNAGLDVSRLYNAMNNNGEWLFSEQLKTMGR